MGKPGLLEAEVRFLNKDMNVKMTSRNVIFIDTIADYLLAGKK